MKELLTPESESINGERKDRLKRDDQAAGLNSIMTSGEPDAKRVKENPAQGLPPEPTEQKITELTKKRAQEQKVAMKQAEKEAEKLRKLAEREAEKQRKEQERQAKKEAKEAERLKREAEREAEKLRKEAEKEAERLRKDAEKQAESERKEAEKQAQRERKEAEKLQKEREKQQREAEKLAEKEKKEAERLRAQPRINLFFKSSPTQSSLSPVKRLNKHQLRTVTDHTAKASHGNENTTAIEGEVANAEPLSDYQRHILPFHAKIGGQVFDSVRNTTVDPSEAGMDPLEWLRTSSRRPIPKSDKLTSQQFQLQLTLAHESSQIAELLTHLRIRRLQFSHLSPKYIADPSSTMPINEEYRPPYVGTTQDLPEASLQSLRRSPCRTDLDANLYYEYDSEVEWDANEEGEDLRDEDGEDSDEDMDDQDELREFLSSDEDSTSPSSSQTSTKRHKLVGPLHPVVLWGADQDLSPFAVQLLGDLSVIDTKEIKKEPVAKDDKSDQAAGDASGVAGGPGNSFSDIVQPVCAKIGKTELRTSLLSHNNSPGTKTLIVELLKQQFPQAMAGEIRQVFDACMERIGKKRAEKRWVLTPSARLFFSIDDSADVGQV